MKELLEQGAGILFIGSLMGGCVLIRLILLGYYGRLSAACKAMGNTKNRTILYIKRDLKERSARNQRPKNSSVYTECRLAECKVGGIRVTTLESVWQQSVLFVPLCGIMIAFTGALIGCGYQMIFSLLVLSGGVFGFLLILDLLGGVRENHRRIRLCIRDYIENTWEMQEGWEEELAEAKTIQTGRELRKEKIKSERECKKQKKINRKADKPVRCRSKKNGKAQEEKRRLTEELLRERRQLEARSLAEARRREKTEEPIPNEVTEAQAEPVTNDSVLTDVPTSETVMNEAVMEEAAVAVTETLIPERFGTVVDFEKEAPEQDFSYEALLSEVLAEYLA